MTLARAVHQDQELVARIRAGDEQAFEQLFRRYNRELCLYAARIDQTGGAAEEIVQDVFFKVWEQRDRLLDVRSLGGYLYAAVRNRALNQRDRVRRALKWQLTKGVEFRASPPIGVETDADMRAAEMSAAIERAIADLPPRCRETFLLRRQAGMSYAQIAEKMGIAPKTVELHIGKALKLLRHSLADWF